MKTSLQKIQELREQLLAPPPADAHPLEMLLRTFMMMGADQAFMELLSDDAGDVDELLEFVAGKILEYRSDDALPLRLPEAAIDGEAREDPAALEPGA